MQFRAYVYAVHCYVCPVESPRECTVQCLCVCTSELGCVQCTASVCVAQCFCERSSELCVCLCCSTQVVRVCSTRRMRILHKRLNVFCLILAGIIKSPPTCATFWRVCLSLRCKTFCNLEMSQFVSRENPHPLHSRL